MNIPVRKNPWVRTAGTRSPDYSDTDDELPWLSYQHFGNLVGNLTDLIVLEQNWQLMIDEIWNTRQVNDYTGKNINKKDFMRSWTHSRTAQHFWNRKEFLQILKFLKLRYFVTTEKQQKYN